MSAIEKAERIVEGARLLAEAELDAVRFPTDEPGHAWVRVPRDWPARALAWQANNRRAER